MGLPNSGIIETWQQRLRMSRDTLASRWYSALLEANPGVDRNHWQVERTATLVEVLLCCLLNDNWYARDAEDTGAVLARNGFNNPETLIITQTIWIDHLQNAVPPSSRATLLSRLSDVLHAVAAGFHTFLNHLHQSFSSEALLFSNPANDDTTILTLFNSMYLGVVTTDKDGHLVMVNQAFEKIVGYSSEELLGTSLTWLSHPDDVKLTSELFDDLRSKKHNSYQLEKRYIRKDNQIIWVHLTVSQIDHLVKGEPYIVCIAEDITTRKVQELELREMKRALAEAREAERLRLAQELHDGPVQHLLGVSYQMKALTKRVGAKSESIARQVASGMQPDIQLLALTELELLHEYILDSVSQLRGLISELRPAGLLELGLTSALEGFVARLEREYSTPLPAFTLTLDESGKELPEPVALCLFRVAQESIRNAIRYANASLVEISLQIHHRVVVLRVRDNGCGFTVPNNINDLTRADHYGLAGIIERISLVEGQCKIVSLPGQGTEIIAIVTW